MSNITKSKKKKTYNSPLRIMSHMTKTWPCWQTDKKMPAVANRANIFLHTSGPAFHHWHLSTQVFKHLASMSCSVTLSYAKSFCWIIPKDVDLFKDEVRKVSSYCPNPDITFYYYFSSEQPMSQPSKSSSHHEAYGRSFNWRTSYWFEQCYYFNHLNVWPWYYMY